MGQAKDEEVEKKRSEVKQDQKPRRRRVRKFSWAAVDPKLTRKLLVALYQSKDDHERLHSLIQLPEGRLELQANRSLGRPPKAQYAKTLAPVLVESWLPRARASTVKRLATLVQAGLGGEERDVSVASKLDALAFLRRRRLTQNFLVNLRRAFVDAHKREFEIDSRKRGTRIRVGVSQLVGEGAAESFAPYPHQRSAWKSLRQFVATSTSATPAGLIVLPTGAGKTETAVQWLLDRLEEDVSARVLWLAHQQELLLQAMARFEESALSREIGFTRKGRCIFQSGSTLNALAEKDLDVAAVTIQSLTRAIPRKRKKLLQAFMKRPTYVVVDEVHHAGAPTYVSVLTEISENAPKALIGLTATPWPTSMMSRYHLRSRFPNVVALSPGSSFKDKDGNQRNHIRIRWWDEEAKNHRDAFFGPGSARTHIFEDPIDEEHLISYAHHEPPVFLGHYWLEGNPEPLAPNIACLDYSVAKSGGKLVAYRWDGEGVLSKEKFVSVEACD